MTNSKHIPKKRFKEFELDGEWEQESLGKIVDFSIKTNSLSREKLSLESYEVQNIHYGDVLIKFDNVLDLKRDSLPSIIDSKVLDFKESLLQDGDLIFADAAEDSTVGKAIEIRNIGGKNIVSGLHTIAARPTQLFAPFYLGYYINSNFYHDQILPLMQGTKVSSISKSNLQVTKITFPTIDEQKELGKFFQTIDSLITLHQHKLDKLKNLKKSYLAELFPAEGERVPKRRFSGFEGEWEVKKLEELGKVITGNTPSTSNASYWSTSSKGHTWVTPTDINDVLICYSERYLSDLGWLTARTVPENSVLITSIASIGKNTINTIPVAFNQQINAIVAQNHNSYFILSAMSRYEKQFKNLAGQTATPIINKLTFEKFEIPVPPIREQEIIGEFFQKLDKSISLQQQKINKLKDLKKSYLNELFV